MMISIILESICMNLYLKEPRAIHIDQECKVKDLNAGER